VHVSLYLGHADEELLSDLAVALPRVQPVETVVVGARFVAELRVMDVAPLDGGALVDGVRMLSAFHVPLLFPGSQGQSQGQSRATWNRPFSGGFQIPTT
jgi:hypothetical protein